MRKPDATIGWALAVVLFGSAQAQEQPDCSDPQTQTDMTICAGQAFDAADNKLNEAYQQAIAVAKQMDGYLDADMKGAEEALREAQRAWIPYREKACEAYGFLARGGSMEPMLVAQCMTDITQNRIAELEAFAQGLGN
jgi:uncharacterized protein YecT (DUF1311 family)